MSTRVLCVITLSIVLSLAVALPRAQALSFFDDFETYDVGLALNGYTAPNGQTWATGWSGNSTVIQVDYGVGWSKNTGSAAGTPDGTWFTNELPLGQELTSGVVTCEATLFRLHGDYENCASYLQFGL